MKTAGSTKAALFARAKDFGRINGDSLFNEFFYHPHYRGPKFSFHHLRDEMGPRLTGATVFTSFPEWDALDAATKDKIAKIAAKEARARINDRMIVEGLDEEG